MPIRITAEPEAPGRWLFVLKAQEGEDGAWATGSFDPKRNKISIHTRGAQEFTIDVSRIPIDWDELVVIGIDGENSELRKRDYSILRFALDDHRQWSVVEP